MNQSAVPPGLGLFLKELTWIPRVVRHSFDAVDPVGPADGPPAMVVPGFVTTDSITAPLRTALGEAGWRTHGWGLGFNGGARPGLIDELARQVDAARDGKPILLVGWSLGGLYARELARAYPDKVSHVVTLGSPFGGEDRRANNAWRLYQWVAGHSVDEPPVDHHSDKPPVPTLAIWSRSDGVIAERAACGTEGECDQSVEVDAAHMEMALSSHAIGQIIPIIEKFTGRSNN